MLSVLVFADHHEAEDEQHIAWPHIVGMGVKTPQDIDVPGCRGIFDLSCPKVVLAYSLICDKDTTLWRQFLIERLVVVTQARR